MINFILILFTTFNFSYAESDQCAYFKHCGSSGNSSKSSSQSMPSASAASSFNPSNISKIKGIGLETLIQANNPLGFSLASGTGKFGGALISPNLENGFFGNRSIELDEVYMIRRTEKKRFKNNKLSVAIGAGLVTKKNFTLDLGISLKRHKEIKKVNPGAGVSMSFFIFNFGYAYYKDDTKVHFGSYANHLTGELYSAKYGRTSYIENFSVQTFSVGATIGNLAVDAGKIKTSYTFYSKQPTDISIYSSALSFKSFLLNFAYRIENSPNMKEENRVLTSERKKTDLYFGLQYMFNRHLVIGLGYNTFLLKELSATVTLYL